MAQPHTFSYPPNPRKLWQKLALASAPWSHVYVGGYSSLCKTVDCGIGAMREDHWNQTGRSTLFNVQLWFEKYWNHIGQQYSIVHYQKLSSSLILSPERTWLFTYWGEPWHCLGDREGVAIKFFKAISETFCGPSTEQDIVPTAYPLLGKAMCAKQSF